ncbi:MAG: 4-hydroxy-tetrahydrodipicolinate reductase, partial [Bacteroidales bacterium]|nr:4-hydroxy-tetrahydrodipicolinate reductase [Bacteroidales bacterium]
MKIALLGYGKMGKEIEKMAIERKHTVTLIIDLDNQHELNSDNLRKADVAIDFSTPDSAVRNIMACFDAGIPVVCGTTGWNKELDRISSMCRDKQQALFYSSNFSIGVNIFFVLNEYMAGLMNNFNQYNVTLEETHHTQKLDAPSGTAISLAEQIIKKLDRKNRWALENPEAKNDFDTLNIKAIREGDIKGIHEISYESEEDIMSIRHFAKSRKGFALGAVMAAEYIKA